MFSDIDGFPVWCKTFMPDPAPEGGVDYLVFPVAGPVDILGTGAGVFKRVVGTSSGSVLLVAIGDSTFKELEGSGTGSLRIHGTGAANFKGLVGSATGWCLISGTGAGNLAKLEGLGYSLLLVSGLGDGAFGKLEGDALVSLLCVGTGDGAFRVLEGTGVGVLVLEGVGASELQKLVGSGSGWTPLPIFAVGASSFRKLVGAGTGVRVMEVGLHAKTFRTQNTLVTEFGGIATRFLNESGSMIPKGTAVAASTASDHAIIPQTTEYDVIGIVHEDIANGAWGWVVTTGVAEALFEDNTAITRGYWVKASAVDGRVRSIAAPTGIGALSTAEHFREVGHCLENKTIGVGVLAKIVIHPL